MGSKDCDEKMADTMKNAWRSPGAGMVLLVVLTVMVYIPAMRGGFFWDDRKYITDNQLVKADNGLYRIWFTTAALGDYYPLTSSLWWFQWRWWGVSPMGYHVVNVLLHGVNAVLLRMILRRLEIPGAWLAALVFAVHPVNVATVAWISEQKNTLSMLFYAFTILLYLRFDREGKWRWYGLSLMAFLMALLSKSAVVMLPVVLWGCVWWSHGRVRRRDLLCSVPFFALSLALGWVTIWFQYNPDMGGHAVRTVGIASRLAAAGWVPWFYLYKALLPFNLTLIYPNWQIGASRSISYVPGLVLIGCLTWFWRKRKTWGRPLLFGLGYFVVMLFPVLGFVDQAFYQFALVADHWQYYSIIGVIALAVATGEGLCRRLGGHGRHWGTVAGMAVLLVLGVASWRRGCVYADEETLWSDNVARNPNTWVAHNNLGYALKQAGKIEEAIAHYQQALRIEPDYAEAHYNLGNALKRLGRIPEAIAHYEQALRIKPDYAEAHNNLGNALKLAGKIEEAIAHYEQALRIEPDFAEAHCNLGNALEQTGRVREGIGHYEQALRLKPDYAEAENNLAWLLATLAPADGGDPVRAVTLAERACELTNNRVAEYLDTLAVAYAAAGRFNDAIAAAQKAIGLARSAGQTQMVSEIETRRELYRAGRAYRAPASVTSPHGP
jgi:tetratricopeptide (TPR) repeat protein